MRIIPSLLILVALSVAGCDTVTERVHEKFSKTTPRSREFRADRVAVESAAILALKRLDFTVGQAAKGDARLEASGQIRHNEALGESRQLVANVDFKDIGPGKTEVDILVTEQVEEASPAGRSEQPLREDGFYETFFDTLQQMLADASTGTASPKPAN